MPLYKISEFATSSLPKPNVVADVYPSLLGSSTTRPGALVACRFIKPATCAEEAKLIIEKREVTKKMVKLVIDFKMDIGLVMA